LSSYYGKEESIKLLVQYGADIKIKTNGKNACTPHDVAIRQKYIKSDEILLLLNPSHKGKMNEGSNVTIPQKNEQVEKQQLRPLPQTVEDVYVLLTSSFGIPEEICNKLKVEQVDGDCLKGFYEKLIKNELDLKSFLDIFGIKMKIGEFNHFCSTLKSIYS